MPRLLVIAIVLLVWPAVAAAKGAPTANRAKAVRTDSAPKIDGVFDDAVWQKAPVNGGFRQEFPHDGMQPTEPTDFRVAYDDKNVYFAVRNHDSSRAGISARLTRRDRDIETDWLCIFIDSRNDGTSAAFFQLSAAGVKVDGQTYNDFMHSLDWDGVWDGAVAVDDGGWNAEFSIPLTALRFRPDSTDWGLQLLRNVSRKRERTEWSYAPRDVQGFVSVFGRLEGISGLKPKRVFELRPYVLTRASARTAEGGGFFGLTGENADADLEADLEAGLDLKLGITPELALDATFNPDFGQVEADQVILNLSRFETFFPEKRPFFLEGRELFETPIGLLYTRRIGRLPTGFRTGGTVTIEGDSADILEAPGALRIWGATKITGALGKDLGVAALAAVTASETIVIRDADGMVRDFDLAPERFHGALRTRWAPSKQSYIGVTATGVTRLGGDLYTARANHDDYAQSVDGWWRDQAGSWRAQAQLVMSERVGGTALADDSGRPCADGTAGCFPVVRTDGTTMGPGDIGFGGYAQVEHSRKHFVTRANWQTLSPRLDINSLGFMPRHSLHEFFAVAGYKQPETRGPFLNHGIFPFVEGALNYEGKPAGTMVGVDVDAEFKNFVFVSPLAGILLPGTYDAFETFDGAYYENRPQFDSNAILRSNPSKPVWFESRLAYRHELGGRGWRTGVDATVYFQVRSNFEISLSEGVAWEPNQVRFYDCQTDTGLACVHDDGTRRYRFAELDAWFTSTTLRATYTLSTELSLQAYGQLFLARGTWDRFRSATTMGDRPTIDREDLSRIADVGDDDGDGVVDGNFDETALNLNLVARWEPIRGSTFFFVYTRAQDAATTVLRRLGRGNTEDVVLLKFVYFWGG